MLGISLYFFGGKVDERIIKMEYNINIVICRQRTQVNIDMERSLKWKDRK